jgi:hypothetical protein
MIISISLKYLEFMQLTDRRWRILTALLFFAKAGGDINWDQHDEANDGLNAILISPR